MSVLHFKKFHLFDWVWKEIHSFWPLYFLYINYYHYLDCIKTDFAITHKMNIISIPEIFPFKSMVKINKFTWINSKINQQLFFNKVLQTVILTSAMYCVTFHKKSHLFYDIIFLFIFWGYDGMLYMNEHFLCIQYRMIKTTFHQTWFSLLCAEWKGYYFYCYHKEINLPYLGLM